MDVEKLTSTEILAIDKPGDLFDRDPETRRIQFMKLRRTWHPDKCVLPEANDVFRHINKLKEESEKLESVGKWDSENEIEFETTEGKRFLFRFLSKKEIDVGEMFIGSEKILFMVKREFQDLFEVAKKNISNFPFKNQKIKEEFKQFLPEIIFAEEEKSTGFAMVVRKPKDSYCLSDVIDYFDGEIEPKSVAWIGSGLFNLAAMFEVSGMTHNGLTSDSIFICPHDHTVYILGGWWFSAKVGETLSSIPSKMARALPSEFFVDKKAKTCYDGTQIKSTLIEALGDKTMLGSKLLKNGSVPKPLLSWLRSTDSGSLTAIGSYESWFKSLEKSFGKRKFVRMNIESNKIYRR